MQKQYRCVQFVPFRLVHRAAVAMNAESRRHEIWQDEFELEYGVKFGTLNADSDHYCLIFPTDAEYHMFLLRWA